MNRKPRILRVTTVALSLKTLLKGQMKFMGDNGFEVLMTSAHDDDIESLEEYENTKHISIPMTREITPFQDLRALREMVSLIRSYKPDIIHTHTPKAGLIGMLAGKFCGVPIRLHTVAGMPLMEKKGVLKSILVAVEKITYKAATKVYPNSNTLARYIIDNNFTRAYKINVIGNGSSNGINTDYFKPSEEINTEARILKSKYELDGNLVIGFVGRLVGDKGINELVKAFDEINRQNQRTKLLLVGPYEKDLDPLKEETEKLINNHPNIITTGFQKDIRPYLALMDIFAFPSYREGFPNVVMQAGCFNLPSVVSDINGCNEIVVDGKNGIIIPPKSIEALQNALLKLINDAALREMMSEKSREMITSRYDQQVVWDKIIQEYDKVLSESGIKRNILVEDQTSN
ncbi:glycosyltransferase family 4 protein [Mangrovivirga sp. M17]|uniref:Glycosyltransferase family 4 protein n=1 Tax=Mangrovivirga halotolerans TaxID=2993936 RepID=A0ABT3RUG5_9BACT|nr:glycosyltransferase family 4 protein [Mangrovivirga halotolerans]MCX2745212.1 glycosyltransferase family 4 protein [Mangrovivirga halotolerans]